MGLTEWNTEVGADSPASWWKFTDASGAIADHGADGNDLSLVLGGPITYQRAGLLAADHAIGVPVATTALEGAPALFGTPTSFTVEALVNPEPFADNAFILSVAHTEDTASGDGFYFYLSDDGFTNYWPGAGVSGHGAESEASSPSHMRPYGEWSWVAGRFDAATEQLTVWHDGCLVATKQPTAITYHADRKLWVASQVKALLRDDRDYQGDLDEVVLYDYALSDARLKAHAAAAGFTCGGRPPWQIGVVGWQS